MTTSATRQPWARFYNPRAAALASPDPMPLSVLLDWAASTFGARPCSSFAEESFSYAEVAAFVEDLAAGFAAAGIGAGDRVGFLAPAHPSFTVFTFALWHVGAIGVGLNPLYSVRRLTDQANDAGLKAIFTLDDAALLGKAAQIRRASAVKPTLIATSARSGDPHAPASVGNGEGTLTTAAIMAGAGRVARATVDPLTQPAVLQYTGGTTGAPKAAVLTHANLSVNVVQMHSWFPELRPGAESVLAAAPVTHVSGVGPIQNFMVNIAGEMAWMPRFDADAALDTIEQRRITLLLAPPTMFTALLHAAETRGKFDWSSLRNAQCGAAPVSAELKKRFRDATGLTITTLYGMTETSPAAIYSSPTPHHERATGIPLPFTEVEVRSTSDPSIRMATGEPGEICIRGPQVMPHYWQRPDATAQAFVDGFFRSGDIGTMDADGAVTVFDRLKDVIIASGYNVYPADVESAVLKHPAVREAAVIGVPCAYRGETVKAIVSMRDAAGLTIENLRLFLADLLSPMEIPKLLEIVDEIPRNENLKISRLALREREARRREG